MARPTAAALLGRYSAKGEFSDLELKEVAKNIPIREYHDHANYPYHGNFLLTKDKAAWRRHVKGLCCGVRYKEVQLSNGQTAYFAFDYGH